MSVRLSGSDLSVTDVVRVARGGERVELDPESRDRMASARAVVEAALHSGEPVYGLTTGVAERKRVLLDADERRSFSLRLVRNHRTARVAAIELAVAAQAIDLRRAAGKSGAAPSLLDQPS